MLPPPTIKDNTLKCYSLIYKFMWLFLWCLKCQGWRRICCRGTHQTHSQVYLVYMSANGSTRGWWALPATLNLTSVYSLDSPNWIWRGCMLAGISPSKTEGAVEEVDSSACSVGTEASGSLDSWGGRWEMKEEGAWQVFLGGGEDVGREECETAPLRSPYKPSASEPVTAASIFSNPSVSRCWALFSSFACFLTQWTGLL